MEEINFFFFFFFLLFFFRAFKERDEDEAMGSSTIGALVSGTGSTSSGSGLVIRSVDELQNGGVNVADIKKLKEAGICTLKRLEMVTRKELAAIRGISDAKVDKILEALGKIHQYGWISGTECKQQRDQVIKITTGSREFDKLLAGGVETGSITELIGEFRTGKTLMCHMLAVTAQLPTSMGGGNGKVAILDTEGAFRPEKIGPIAERFGLDGDAVLENIVYARAMTHEALADLLPAIASKMATDQFRLLIVDSLTSTFRTDFSGRGELSERQQKLGKLMASLTKLATEFGVAVVVTNQVSFFTRTFLFLI